MIVIRLALVACGVFKAHPDWTPKLWPLAKQHAAKAAAVLAACVMLAGCAVPGSGPVTISNQPIAATGALGQSLIKGAQAAASNLDQAIKIGVLPAADPADGCLHGLLQEAGADITTAGAPATPAQSFQAQNIDPISYGSILYIQAHQASALTNLTQPAACDALIGQFVRLAVQKGVSNVGTAVQIIQAL